MKRVLLATIGILVMTAVCAQAQSNPCDTNASGPFFVTSAKSFKVQVCTEVNRVDPATNQTVPERIDGWYLSLDQPLKTEATPISLGISTVTNRHAWEFTIASGIARGSHTVYVGAWNYVLDPNTGQPTTERGESPMASAPFTAVDPVTNLPPLTPTGIRIIK